MSPEALRASWQNPALRSLQSAMVVFTTASWAYKVGLAVYAYHVGGAAGVAVAALVRTLPAALFGPTVGALGDRHSRCTLMAGGSGLIAVTLAASAGCVAVGGAPGAVYALSVLYSLGSIAYRVGRSALLPALVSSPRELGAANGASTFYEGVAVFAGPVLAAGLLATGSAATVFIVSAGLTLVATLMGLRGQHVATAATAAEPEPFIDEAHASLPAAPAGKGGRAVRVALGLLATQLVASGALNVLIVVCAIDLLGLGSSGPGLLTAAYGVGSVLGGLAAGELVSSLGLGRSARAGLLLWGIPLALLAAFAEPSAAVALLALVGAGNALFAVSSETLLQRVSHDGARARTFGVLETVVKLGLALGALVAPLLIDVLGIRGALLATGAFMPAVAVLAGRHLSMLQSAAAPPQEDLELLRGLPTFAGLPTTVIERLAWNLERVPVTPGVPIVRQGDHGDRFYAIACGDLRVTIDGHECRQLGPGDGFGEIALLRDVPRTATVTPAGPAKVRALRGDDFLAVLFGHPGCADAAEAIASARLAHANPSLVPATSATRLASQMSRGEEKP
jgi:MFS family permease